MQQILATDTTHTTLLKLCNGVDFATKTPDVIAHLESFPCSFDDATITDEYVLGTQEFAALLTQTFDAGYMHGSTVIVCEIAAAILYHWWKVNIRDNTFTETEINV